MKVVSFRIPCELKKEMDKLDVNWSEEVRALIESRVKDYRRKKALNEMDVLLANLPGTKAGTAAKYVRGDRDSR